MSGSTINDFDFGPPLLTSSEDIYTSEQANGDERRSIYEDPIGWTPKLDKKWSVSDDVIRKYSGKSEENSSCMTSSDEEKTSAEKKLLMLLTSSETSVCVGESMTSSAENTADNERKSRDYLIVLLNEIHERLDKLMFERREFIYNCLNTLAVSEQYFTNKMTKLCDQLEDLSMKINEERKLMNVKLDHVDKQLEKVNFEEDISGRMDNLMLKLAENDCKQLVDNRNLASQVIKKMHDMEKNMKSLVIQHDNITKHNTHKKLSRECLKLRNILKEVQMYTANKKVVESTLDTVIQMSCQVENMVAHELNPGDRSSTTGDIPCISELENLNIEEEINKKKKEKGKEDKNEMDNLYLRLDSWKSTSSIYQEDSPNISQEESLRETWSLSSYREEDNPTIATDSSYDNLSVESNLIDENQRLEENDVINKLKQLDLFTLQDMSTALAMDSFEGMETAMEPQGKSLLDALRTAISRSNLLTSSDDNLSTEVES